MFTTLGRGDRLLGPAEQGETLIKSLPGARLTAIDGGRVLPVTQGECTSQLIVGVADGVFVVEGVKAA